MAKNKTGLYQDRENGMLKNHGMLKDLGMMQEEGMRGMRRMRNLHQTGDLKNNPDIKYAGDVADESAQDSQLRAEMEAAKGTVPKMEIKPVSAMDELVPVSGKTTPTKMKSLYAGEPIDIKYGGKSMRVSGVESYTKPSGSTGYTVNRPSKGAFGIEVPEGTEQYKAIQKSLKKGYIGS